jgi:hypothetical protein
LNEDFAVLVFMVFNSIGITPEQLKSILGKEPPLTSFETFQNGRPRRGYWLRPKAFFKSSEKMAFRPKKL